MVNSRKPLNFGFANNEIAEIQRFARVKALFALKRKATAWGFIEMSSEITTNSPRKLPRFGFFVTLLAKTQRFARAAFRANVSASDRFVAA